MAHPGCGGVLLRAWWRVLVTWWVVAGRLDIAAAKPCHVSSACGVLVVRTPGAVRGPDRRVRDGVFQPPSIDQPEAVHHQTLPPAQSAVVHGDAPAAGWQLDVVMPTWARRERHQRRVAQPRLSHIDAAHDLTWSELPLTHALLCLMAGPHRLRGDQRVLSMFTDNGWHLLHRDDHQLLVVGILPARRGSTVHFAGPPKSPTVASVAGFSEPGCTKVALAFHLHDDVLSTETRVTATDVRSAFLFGLYWMIIRGPSGLIRREWLRAIELRALRGGWPS